MPAEIEEYEDLEVHRLMLRDETRTRVFQHAIFCHVNPGDVVLDMGAGTGVLSLFAAQAGAGRIFAVERTKMAKFASRLARENGFEDRIEVIQQDIEKVGELPPVDVIVSEWLGVYGVNENLLGPLLVARDRWLKPGGRMLPARVSVWLAPVDNQELDEDMAFWRDWPYDLDLSPVAERSVEDLATSLLQEVLEDEVLAEPQLVWDFDMLEFPAEKAAQPLLGEVTFRMDKDCSINALAAWFSADFGKGMTLSNAPGAPATHWGQFVAPLRFPVSAAPGTPVRVRFSSVPVQSGYSDTAWSVQVGSRPWLHHDTSAVRE